MKKFIEKYIIIIYLSSVAIIALLIDFLLIKLGVPDEVVYFHYKRRTGSYGMIIVLFVSAFCLFEYHFYLRKFKPEKLLNPSVTKEDLKTSRTHDIISQIVMFSLLIPVFFLIKSIIKYL